MKTRIIALSMLLAAAMVAAGCEELSYQNSKLVRFSATSDTPATKTAYSGRLYSGYERIDWKKNDMIYIYSPELTTPGQGNQAGKHYAKYMVTDDEDHPITGSNEKSNAQIDNADGNGLEWGTVQEHPQAHFFAVYPYDARSTNPDDYKTIDLNMGAEQTMEWRDNPRAGAPLMAKYAPMVAWEGPIDNSEDPAARNVNLRFYPAFNAFEIHLVCSSDFPTGKITLLGASLTCDSSFLADDPDRAVIAGDCVYDFSTIHDSGNTGHIGTIVRCANPSKTVSVTIPGVILSNETEDEAKEVVFTLFTLPKNLKDMVLTMKFQWAGETVTRSLKLNQNGTPMTFYAGHKTRLRGVALTPEIWTFAEIDLEGNVIDWIDKSETDNSNDVPQSSQFAVSGVQNVYQIHNTEESKAYRQYWITGNPQSSGMAAKTATVTFKILAPTDGTYAVVPMGDVDYFTDINNNALRQLTGTISGVTTVTFTVRSKQGLTGSHPDNPTVYFKTYVTSRTTGATYSLDSETQLYDMRGYHYFVWNDPLGT